MSRSYTCAVLYLVDCVPFPMGIRGLTSFVNDQQKLLLRGSEVSGQHLIVDGKALLHFLYHEANFDVRFGGSYFSFCVLLKDFFKQLRTCGIKPIVVLDGGCSKYKQNTKVSRQQENVNLAFCIMESHFKEEAQSYRLLPPMTSCVFCQTLHEMEIPVVRSEADADREIAALANALAAPVLSNDSDFYVLDVASGYFPLSHFQWSETFENERDSLCMRGLRFQRDRLLSAYRLDRSMLAFLSILLGSDWLPRDTFSVFLHQITQGCRATRKVGAVLKWLSKQTDEQTVIDTLLRQIGKKQRSQVLESVQWCLAFYNTLPTACPLLRHLESTSMGEIGTSGTFKAFDDCDAQWSGTGHAQSSRLEEIVASGDVPTFIVSLFTNDGKTHLPVFLAKRNKPSAHEQCARARHGLYRLLAIREFLPTDVTIAEFDRDGETYHETSAIRLHELRSSPCACHHVMSTYDDATIEWRQSFLVESLFGCKTSADGRSRHLLYDGTINRLREANPKFCSRFELMWMSVVSWISAGVSFALAISLVLVLVHGCFEETSPNLLLSAFDATECDHFKHVADLSQWQCWVQMTLALNCVLGYPCSRATIGVFDCKTVASVYNQVITWKKHLLIEEIDRRLTSMPLHRQVVSLLAGALKRHVASF